MISPREHHISNRIGDGRIPQLDGLRGLAILQVIIWHYHYGIIVEQRTVIAYALRLVGLTWSGVDLFFVLSGFLIGGILIDKRTVNNYFTTFYVRRFFRIVPLYFIMLVLGFALNTFGQLGEGIDGG
jgi:peptidoglycan/LPS O-acetylase OafA/YrhL